MASFKSINYESIDILSLIPQRPPMVMVDRMLYCSDTTTITSLKVDKNNIFFKDGLLREPALIENMAQTAAAGSGYRMATKSVDEKIPVGFIGAVKNLTIHYLPKEGEELVTEVSVLHQVFDAAVILGVIKSSNKFVAECEMKIFTKTDK